MDYPSLEEQNIIRLSLHFYDATGFAKPQVAFDSQPAYISTDTDWGRKVFGVYEAEWIQNHDFV